MNQEAVIQFFRELSGVIPPSNIMRNPSELTEYAVNSAPPDAVIFPENKEQVCEIIKSARQQKITLIPWSSGPSRISTVTLEGQSGVVVDFSRMKTILKIDELSRYAWIEPGVTFGELIPALKKQGMRLNTPFRLR